ncbi:MAG: hypothetical protein RL499_1160 [Actinomycetota bacterium]
MLAPMTQTQMLGAGAVVLLLTLAGCTPPEQPSEPVASPSTAASETAAPSPSSEALPDDVLLVVSAVATADNGAVLDLTMTVHRSLAFDDPGVGDFAALMTDACGGGTDEALYADQLWTFTNAEVEAVARPGTAWPANHPIFFQPLATYVPIAADGAVVDDENVDPATPRCLRDKHLDAAGSGALIVGLEGDTDDVSAAGQFTRWANSMWGFTGVYVAGQSAADAGIVLSDCTYIVTDAGKALNGGSAEWIERIDDERCEVGNPTI